MKLVTSCAVRALLVFVFLAFVGTLALVFAPDFARDAGQNVVDLVDKPASANDSPVPFVVNQGDSAAEIGSRLKAMGLISSEEVFRLLVTYYRVGARLEAGQYELRPNMSSTEIISILHQGLVKTTMLTIPEGWRIAQIDDHLAKKGIFAKGEFIAASRENAYKYAFLSERPPGVNLEGYLFPDTYSIAPSLSARDLADYMLRNFDRRVTTVVKTRSSTNSLTLHETITLASIVEREAAVATERPLIASVFRNRLRLGMPLQADPTVQYAIANDASSVTKYGFWKIGLTVNDLEVISAYNTYHNQGLPPGPIANPGLASIQAVIEPEDSDFLYFVAKDDGSHAFAKTLEEHERNIFRYRR